MTNINVIDSKTSRISHRAPIFGDASEELHRISGAPPRMCAAALLSAMSIASQCLIDVKTPDGRLIVVMLYILILAKTGERKSRLFRHAMKSIKLVDKKLEKRYLEELQLYKHEHKLWSIEFKALERRFDMAVRKGEVGQERTALSTHLHAEPVMPQKKQLLYGDVTSAAFRAGLSKSEGIGSIVSSEAAGIFLNRLPDLVYDLNEYWSGDDVKTDTYGKDSVRVQGRVTVALQIQPELFSERKLNKTVKYFLDLGFMSRFLVYKPESNIGKRKSGRSSEIGPALQRFHLRIEELLAKSLGAMSDPDFERIELNLSPEAKDLFLSFEEKIENEMQEKGRYEYAAGHGTKLGEVIIRVAAIIHWFEGVDGDISIDTLKLAYEICDECSNDYVSVFSQPPKVVLAARDLFAQIQVWRGEDGDQDKRYVKKNFLATHCRNWIRKEERLFEDVYQLLLEEGTIEEVWGHQKYYEGQYQGGGSQLWVDLRPDLPRGPGFCPKPGTPLKSGVFTR